jgi:hypothetical protein
MKPIFPPGHSVPDIKPLIDIEKLAVLERMY